MKKWSFVYLIFAVLISGNSTAQSVEPAPAQLVSFYTDPRLQGNLFRVPLVNNVNMEKGIPYMYRDLNASSLILKRSEFEGLMLFVQAPRFSKKKPNGDCFRLKTEITAEFYGYIINGSTPTIQLYKTTKAEEITNNSCYPSDNIDSLVLSIDDWKDLPSPGYTYKIIRIKTRSIIDESLSRGAVVSETEIQSHLSLQFPLF